jgi:hypothetical protein
MRGLALLIGVVVAGAPVSATAQDEALGERVMARVRSALAGTFVASDDLGSLPADGRATGAWMIRPHQTGDRAIEILANPLNEDYQRRAAKAMAEIGQSIEAAQRRAELQYERAIAEAKRTRRSQDVDGVTLSDEGVAGARIDAESHVTIEVLFNQPAYKFEVRSAVEPLSSGVHSFGSIPAAAATLWIAANVYRDAEMDVERFCEAETYIFLGRTSKPEIDHDDRTRYTMTATGGLPSTATAISSIVIRLRGNERLVADLARKSNWGSVVELIE